MSAKKIWKAQHSMYRQLLRRRQYRTAVTMFPEMVAVRSWFDVLEWKVYSFSHPNYTIEITRRCWYHKYKDKE